MVFIVVLSGQPSAIARAEQSLQAASTGWAQVQGHVWLASSYVTAKDLRDYISKTAPGIQLMIMRVTQDWAGAGFTQQANWLNQVYHAF